MRILILCYEFPPIGGGGAKVVRGLSKELVRQGHSVDVVTMGYRDLPRIETVDGITVHRVRCIRLRLDRCSPGEMALYLPRATFTVLGLLKTRKYDVCNTHFIFPDGLISLILKRWMAIRFVVTAHGSDVPGYNPDRFKLLHRSLKPVWRMVSLAAERIICPSPTLEALVNGQCGGAKTTVIANGFDAMRFRPAGVRKPYILVVTRLFERKGVQTLIRAYSKIEGDFELHIVGDGPYLPALRALAEECPRPIKFWGWLDNSSPALRELFETSAIFAFPSAAENFPVCLLEAMAGGMAIVTTRGTGCADVTGESALLVDPDDVEGLRAALVRLIDDGSLRMRLGHAAHDRFERNFTWPTVVRQYVNLYREVTDPLGTSP